ncbi:MAG: site-specific recombinase, partial [Pseudomonadota bacterium]|nr:site-specific recombinase [Pseudomonadota bacterium]
MKSTLPSSSSNNILYRARVAAGATAQQSACVAPLRNDTEVLTTRETYPTLRACRVRLAHHLALHYALPAHCAISSSCMLTLLEQIAADPDCTAIDRLAALVDQLRPGKSARRNAASAQVRTLTALLQGQPAYAAALRHYLLRVLSKRRHTTLFTDTGILPSDGFFSELFRRLSYRILPPALDDMYLSDCLDRILWSNTDYVWMRAVGSEHWLALFDVIVGQPPATDHTAPIVDLAERRSARLEMLEAIQVLSHRISAMGLEPALVRIHPDLENFESPFLVQNVEVHQFLDSALAQLNDGVPATEDAAHLLVMLEQCDDVITRIRKNALQLGTSVALTYLLVRLSQSVERLRRILSIIDLAPHAPDHTGA